MSWVRKPVRAVSVSWKLSKIEELRQDRRFVCFDEDITGTTATTPKKQSWVRVPVKMVSVARKLSMTEERSKEKFVRFGEATTGTVTNLKTPGFESR
jgi:uncharacterized protein YcbX